MEPVVESPLDVAKVQWPEAKDAIESDGQWHVKTD